MIQINPEATVMPLSEILEKSGKEPLLGLHALTAVESAGGSSRIDPFELRQAYTAFQNGIIEYFTETLSPQSTVEEKVTAIALGRLLEQNNVFLEENNLPLTQDDVDIANMYLELLVESANQKYNDSILTMPEGLKFGDVIPWSRPEIYDKRIGVPVNHIIGKDERTKKNHPIDFEHIYNHVTAFGGTPVVATKYKKGTTDVVLVPDTLSGAGYPHMTYSDFVTLVKQNQAYPLPRDATEWVRDKWEVHTGISKKDLDPKFPTDEKKFYNLDYPPFGQDMTIITDYEKNHLSKLALPKQVHDFVLAEVDKIIRDVADQKSTYNDYYNPKQFKINF